MQFVKCCFKGFIVIILNTPTLHLYEACIRGYDRPKHRLNTMLSSKECICMCLRKGTGWNPLHPHGFFHLWKRLPMRTEEPTHRIAQACANFQQFQYVGGQTCESAQFSSLLQTLPFSSMHGSTFWEQPDER